MPLKPSMETPIDLIAFEHYFGHFFEAFPSFYNMQQPVAKDDCTTSCSIIFRPFLSAGMTQLWTVTCTFYVDVNLYMQYILVMRNKR